MEQVLTLSQMGLGALMLIQFYMYYRLSKMMGRFLQKVRLEPPVERRATLFVGQQAPDFKATDQTGRDFDSKILRGRSVLRLFTLPTCPICRTIVPQLMELRFKYPDVSLVVVTSDEGGAETEGLTTDVTLIHSTAIRKQHAITSVPTMVFVDGDNRVIAKDRVTSFEDLAKRLEVLLQQRGGLENAREQLVL